jgi:hypothetical protein
LEYLSLVAKFTCSKLDTNQNCFACSKHPNLENGQSLLVSNVVFLTKCAPILLKIGEDFNIDD